MSSKIEFCSLMSCIRPQRAPTECATPPVSWGQSPASHAASPRTKRHSYLLLLRLWGQALMPTPSRFPATQGSPCWVPLSVRRLPLESRSSHLDSPSRGQQEERSWQPWTSSSENSSASRKACSSYPSVWALARLWSRTTMTPLKLLLLRRMCLRGSTYWVRPSTWPALPATRTCSATRRISLRASVAMLSRAKSQLCQISTCWSLRWT